MSNKNERLGIKLSRDSVVSLKELKLLMYGTSDLPVSDSFVIGEAYKEIMNEVSSIDWLKLNDPKVKISAVSDNNDPTLTSMRTTLSLERNVYEGMQEIQRRMIKEINGRVFFSFVVKLVLFAAILSKNDHLESFKKNKC